MPVDRYIHPDLLLARELVRSERIVAAANVAHWPALGLEHS
jgi:hypothetical protein